MEANRIASLLLCVAFSTLASAVSAQLQIPNGTGIVTIGVGGPGPEAIGFYNVGHMTTPTAHDALVTAIAALPAGGGEVVFLPGDYPFDPHVVITKPNVTISGAGRVVLRPSDTTAGPVAELFLITGSGFTLRHVEVEKDAPTADNAAIRIEASDVTLRGCTFRRTGGDSGYSLIRAEGTSEAERLSTIKVLDCDFRLEAGSVGTGTAGFHAVNAQGIRLVGNRFRGGATNNGGDDLPVVLASCLDVSIAANSFVGLGNDSDPMAAVIRVGNGYSSFGDREGFTGLTVSGNSIRNSHAVSSLEIRCEGAAVVGNDFAASSGRSIHLNPSGAGNRLSAVVAGNRFEGSAAGSIEQILLDDNDPAATDVGPSATVVWSNQFAQCTEGAQIVGTERAVRTIIASNAFAGSTGTNLVHAIALTNGADSVIYGNTAHGSLWHPSVYQLGSPSGLETKNLQFD